MKFLIAFVAILGYASAGLVAPVVYSGDEEAAIINAKVAARDYTRGIVRQQLLQEEEELRNKNAAIRREIDITRDQRDSAYWRGVVAAQNYEAAVQSQAAAIDGAAASARAAYQTALLSATATTVPIGTIAPVAPIAPIAPIAPLAYAGYGAHGIAPYGLRAW